MGPQAQWYRGQKEHVSSPTPAKAYHHNLTTYTSGPKPGIDIDRRLGATPERTANTLPLNTIACHMHK